MFVFKIWYLWWFLSFPSKKRLALAEVLENLDFFIDDLSEEYNADEDCNEIDLNNLGRQLLCAKAEAYWQGTTLCVNRK